MNTVSISQGRRSTEDSVRLRRPRATDGHAIHALVEACPPLDRNSAYCNLLQASHFAETSVVAELDGRMVGCITGYRLPEDPSVLFIWQVAVAPAGRGRGLAGRMLRELAERHAPEVRYLHTTITEDNAASWALFNGFAQKFDAPTRSEVLFSRDTHFGGTHDDEVLLQIGPLNADARQVPARRLAGAGRN
ncbi:MAG: diaminobutyrate acetyltransferase [Pseudomonadales bacterium]|jgi:L-2,4-diaminobutyric acid acetyltransferase|nr:diaminobutyrate acetyltransferase [Pseudomonadales bacterium]